MAAHAKPLPQLMPKMNAATPKLLARKAPARRIATRQPVPAAKAKAHFLQLLDEVEHSREPITITKRGRVVAQLTPVAAKEKPSAFDSLYGRTKGWMKITGDIVSPDRESWGPEWQ